MRYVGIDIASETHVAAVVDDKGEVLLKSTAFGEDADGYSKLLGLLGQPADTLVALEATGHYWKNLVATLLAQGFQVALLNPIRTRHFAGQDLQRAKTDAIDAVGIARFASQKKLTATRLPDTATEELRELVRHRERLVQDFGDRQRQLHRLVDLGFPEFLRHVKSLDSELATAILHDYPTAEAFRGLSVKRLARLCYDGRHKVGPDLAHALIERAKVSVGHHHASAYRLQVRHTCEDLDLLRRRIREIDGDIDRTLGDHEVGTLLTSIEGIGKQTAARLIAELGDPAEFRDASALASYVGVCPATSQSGKHQGQRAGITPLGNARLRRALWMPTLTAVRKNPWLKAYYEGLRARGKLPKVALIAAMRKLLIAVHWVASHRRAFNSRLLVPTEASS